MDVKNEKGSNTIAIVGGGAAGLFAAYFAKLKHPQNRVILIDKNSYLGAKVLISGGGRCNVTTGLINVQDILKNYPRGEKFLRTAMENFPPAAVMSWFETQGVALKTESDLRVFPISNNGHDIVDALTRALHELGVETILNTSVIDLQYDAENTFILSIKDSQPITAKQVILTTGGSAYRHTGSTGDGYSFATKMGHHITALAPSLTSLKTTEEWCHTLAGLSFKQAELQLSDDSNTTNSFQRRGDFLITHQGLSGPAVFALSALIAHQPISEDHPRKLSVNFFPELSPLQLSTKLDEIIATNPKKRVDNIIALFVPHSLSTIIVTELLKINSNKQATHLNKADRQNLVTILQNLPLTVTGRGAGDEMVTAGGIDLAEVNPQTMESKLCRGLFFAGELLDIDGFTGGFNLQASWASGALAGESTY